MSSRQELQLLSFEKGEVVSKSVPMPEVLMDIFLEDVIFSAEWAPEVILPDNLPVVDSSQEGIVENTPELDPEKEKQLKLEKEKSVAARSRCLRSTAPGRSKRRKGTKKRRVRSQDMIEGGTYYSDKSYPDTIEEGCLLLGLTQDVIDLD